MLSQIFIVPVCTGQHFVRNYHLHCVIHFCILAAWYIAQHREGKQNISAGRKNVQFKRLEVIVRLENTHEN